MIEQSLEELIQLGEKDRRNLLAFHLKTIVERSLKEIQEISSFEVAERIVMLSLLVKLKSELLLLLFNLENLKKRTKEFSEDQEIVDIFSALEKNFAAKTFEKAQYIEVIEEEDDIPMLKLSRIVKEILEREKLFEERIIKRQDISIKEITEKLQARIIREKSISFEDLLRELKSRIEIVVTFLAVLILAKNKFVRIRQEGSFGIIYIELHDKTKLSVGN